jgi:hypothetical protein
MLPSFEFIWNVFVSLFVIIVGILALYWVCSSIIYLGVLAVDMEVRWAKRNGGIARTGTVAKASIAMFVLLFLGVAIWVGSH